MKLSVLFAKYLYQNKELNLPGIGTFSIDPNIPTPEPSDKQFADYVQQIKFTQKPVSRPDDKFIDFIRTQTGKIRPLAESDLDSYLSDGKILLNIGKPFFFEGIGSLLKNRDGRYVFTPGAPLVDRVEMITADKIVDKKPEAVASEEGYRSESNSSRKLLVTAAVIVGLAAVVAGGYYMYNRNNPAEEQPMVSDASQPLADSLSLLKVDSSQTIGADTMSKSIPPSQPEIQPAALTSGAYRFIIETTNSKSRAIKRFNQLKSYLIDVRMDTPADSSAFKLYFVLPAQPADTSRLKDSLSRMYGRKVLIER